MGVAPVPGVIAAPVLEAVKDVSTTLDEYLQNGDAERVELSSEKSSKLSLPVEKDSQLVVVSIRPNAYDGNHMMYSIASGIYEKHAHRKRKFLHRTLHRTTSTDIMFRPDTYNSMSFETREQSLESSVELDGGVQLTDPTLHRLMQGRRWCWTEFGGYTPRTFFVNRSRDQSPRNASVSIPDNLSTIQTGVYKITAGEQYNALARSIDRASKDFREFM